ncbi:MAG: transposase [Bdellovibrionales bacterium]|nr:transposase [Bdellovibrionales bacterium]
MLSQSTRQEDDQRLPRDADNLVPSCQRIETEPFLKFAKTIRKYRRNIEAYITSRLTTAVAEGLNNKIKVLRRMGYGYTNPTSYCRKILQRCGYLNHLSINTDEFFYKVPAPR